MSTAESFQALIEGRHENPFELLGPRRRNETTRTVRAYLPNSKKVWLVHAKGDKFSPMRQIDPKGLFEGELAVEADSRYQLRVERQDGQLTTMHDPYAFSPMLTEYDLYLLGEGQHQRAYERLGAHPREVDGVTGVNFAVWAPNATGVSVVGDLNGWDTHRHAMRKHIPNGIWELFIPGIGLGENYKYRVNREGHMVDKCDPYGFAAELPPRTASIVADLDSYQWNDGDWLRRRAATNLLEKPISIYEVHLGSWRRAGPGPTDWLGYRELAEQLVDYCVDMGFTHIELLPVSEHPYSASWGYQTVGYHAVTSRHGNPEEFMHLVDVCHQRGIGVIVDWVPAHFPKDDHGLRLFDGTALYEHADPRQGEHPDWGTLIFNYDRTEVRNFLVANALFWLDKYHIDGLRVDAVASMLYLDYSREEGDWIPNQYGGHENLGAISLLKEFNETAHREYPGVLTIAEESTAWGGVSRPIYDGGLGFSLKWNMGWMNDTLRYFQNEPIHRQHHHDELTFSMIYAFTENFCLPLSHDEVVHGKGSLLDQMPGDLWQKFANLRLLYGYMWTHPGKKLLFMGSEFGQWHEWNHDESLQWHLLQWESHQGMQRWVADLNKLLVSEPALHEADFEGHGFEWIDCMSREDSVLAYVRKANNWEDHLIVCANFTPVVREKYRVGVLEPCYYREVLNSDSTYYGGSDVGHFLGSQAEPIEAQGRFHSIEVSLPPLAVTVLKPER